MAIHKVGEVVSIGLDSRGASVLRINFPAKDALSARHEADVQISIRDFATLAGLGVRVYNEYQRNPK